MQALIHGMILAFGLILPLGVQNVFIFNQGATHARFSQATPAVITAGLCDTILILLAVTGVSVAVLTFDWLTTLLFSAGFLFLVYMGWVMWKSQPADPDAKAARRFSAKRQITFAATVSLLNPHAIIDTIGVIGTSSLAYSGQDKLLFTASCIIVSWLWFSSLALAGKRIRSLGNSHTILRRMNQLSAIIIWMMAVYLAAALVDRI